MIQARTLGPGDFVKVTREGQRMWWEVLSVNDRTITAKLDSTPATEIEWQPGAVRKLPIQPTYKRGDVITFDFNEVIDVCT